MPPTIQVGTILMKDWPGLTQPLGLESEPCSGSWSVLKVLDSFALDRKIHAAGWNFFFMAAEVKVMFFGEDRERVAGPFAEGTVPTLQQS
jgi:hypothetical protein